jgi:membrane protein implicated in regulation of membrane protease activity
MDDPEVWRWVWLVAAFAFAAGEIATAGSFVLLPFAAGALVASLLAFLGVDVVVELIAFLAVSVACLLALYPLRKRLDRAEPQDGIGARRLLGQPAVVLADVGSALAPGMVRVGREEWRAESLDGTTLTAGTPVKVVDVRGTRVVVFRTERSPDALEEHNPPTEGFST